MKLNYITALYREIFFLIFSNLTRTYKNGNRNILCMLQKITFESREFDGVNNVLTKLLSAIRWKYEYVIFFLLNKFEIIFKQMNILNIFSYILHRYNWLFIHYLYRQLVLQCILFGISFKFWNIWKCFVFGK